MLVTRRQVVVGGSTAAAVVTAASLVPAAKAAAGWTRHSATSPEGKAMLAKYAKAVDIMKNRIPATDARNWNFQWFTHWVPGPSPQTNWEGSAWMKATFLDQTFGPKPSPTRSLAEAMWNACQSHGKDPANPTAFQEGFFLPWHRWYVYYFEQILRGVLQDDSFALPYWDYLGADPKAACIPPEFTDTSSPLYVSIRNPWVNMGERIDKQNPGTLNFDAALTDVYISSDNQTGFCPELDNNPHGLVHDYTGNGNNMGYVPTAAQDPIFWLHHCNIDRLWASWNKAGNRNPTWENRLFPFADAAGRRVEANLNGASSTAQLGYDYDSYQPIPTTEVAQAMSLRASALTAVKPAVSKADTIRLSGKARTAVPLQRAAAADHHRLSAAPSGASAVYLVLSGVEIERTMGGTFNVFLDLPSGAQPTPDSPHFVGTFGSFALGKHGDHADHADHAGGGSVTLNASTAVARLAKAGKLSATPSVTFVPMGPVTKPPTVASVALVTN